MAGEKLELILHSERLLLRPLDMSDAGWCVDMLTDPDVALYIYDGQTPTREEAAEEMVFAVCRCAGGCIGIWAIIERDTGDPLGTTALLPLPIDADDTEWERIRGDEVPDGEIEIGYILRKSAWDRGIATEAAARLLQFAFEDSPLEEVVAVVDDPNVASINVVNKVGFRDEGMRRAYAEQVHGYRITRADWQNTVKS